MACGCGGGKSGRPAVEYEVKYQKNGTTTKERFTNVGQAQRFAQTTKGSLRVVAAA